MTSFANENGPGTGSITTLYIDAQNGSEDAAAKLVARLWPAVQAYSRRRFRLGGWVTKSGTDFASEAIVSFQHRLKTGELTHNHNRKDLATFVARLAVLKALHHARHESALKRGGNRVLQVSQLNGDEALEFEQMSARYAPETLDANCCELLDLLTDDLCRVAMLTLSGFLQREIADELGCHPSTVERKLKRIRARWNEYLK